ncbi:hypothetical protein [Psychromonas ossibalaenae]|uniref:hypothetical protein n=1 Tax=Psychromonas ossibalaenae TaxID=444922 RepID=UPI000363B1AB|nr:hypothetical protein [Psychromonas ossibalaenae]
MGILSKVISLLAVNISRLITFFSNIQQFQERIWVVSIQPNLEMNNNVLNNTFLVSEDSFDSPMQWMEKQGYRAEIINRVDRMRRSQVIKIQLENSLHSLIRVK